MEGLLPFQAAISRRLHPTDPPPASPLPCLWPSALQDQVTFPVSGRTVTQSTSLFSPWTTRSDFQHQDPPASVSPAQTSNAGDAKMPRMFVIN